MVERAVVIPALVFLAVMLLGLYLIRGFQGRAGMAVFALFTLLACIAAFMTMSIMVGRALDSDS